MKLDEESTLLAVVFSSVQIIIRHCQHPVQKQYHDLFVLGGTESHTFNRLEEIALDWKAKTPVLGCQISRVLVRLL